MNDTDKSVPVDDDPIGRMSPMEKSVGIFRGYVSPIIAILGLIGNSLAFAIFLKRSIKKSTRNRFQIYTMVLAVSDSVVLIFNTFLDDFLGRGMFYASGGHTILKFDIASNSACKLMEYMSPTFVFISGYILVVFSLDRVLTVMLPIKFQSSRWMRSCYSICFGIFFTGCVVTSPLAVAYEVILINSGTGTYEKCDPVFVESSAIDIATFSLYFTSMFSFFLPCFLVVIFNLTITIRIYKLRASQQTLSSKSSENKIEMGRVVSHLAISTLFLVCTVPVTIIIFMRMIASDLDLPPSYQSYLAHTSRLISSMKDFSYAVNGYLYMIYFPFFRNQVFAWLTCSLYRPNSTVETTEKN